MNNSVINSYVSMQSLQKKIDILANNIANVDTVGYKRKDASFQDVLASFERQGNEFQLEGRVTPLGFPTGWGARLSELTIDMSQGTLIQTGQPLDLALEGMAMFEVQQPVLDADGEQLEDEAGEPMFQRAFTRGGAFQQVQLTGDDANVYLATQDGLLLRDADGEPIAVPRDHRVTIDELGNVKIYNNLDADDVGEVISRLRVVKVLHPEVLTPVGNSMYIIPANVQNEDDVVRNLDTAEAFEDEGVTVRQGFLEQSNVTLADEMTELLAVQRAYQLNARAISSADTLANLANNLRSG